MKVAIIGGGATGLICASYLCKHSQCKVDIFEVQNRVGKKILTTGNGRCNFSNHYLNATDYNDEQLVVNLLNDELLAYFTSLGLYYYYDSQGRYYPLSNQASTILDLLRQDYLINDRFKELTSTNVKKIYLKDNKYILEFSNQREAYDIIVIAIGSKINNPLFDDSLIHQLSLKYQNTSPSLVPLLCNTMNLTGQRLSGDIEVYNNDKLIYSEYDGEVQFKDRGISGINIYSASFYLNKEHKLIQPYIIIKPIKIKYEQYRKDLLVRFNNRSNEPLLNLFRGIFSKQCSIYILQANNLKNTDLINSIDIKILDELIQTSYYWCFNINGFFPLNDGQVSHGGVLTESIDENFESKVHHNLYLGGEILNVDAKCGGFNLHYAFSSGLKIAKHICKKIKHD